MRHTARPWLAQETTIGAPSTTSAAIAARLFRFLEAIPDFDFHLQAAAVDQQSRAVGNAGQRKLYERRAFTWQATAPDAESIPRADDAK